MIPTDDRGLLLGDGLFETILWTGGGLEAWDRHMDRLVAGCEVLDLPSPERARLHAAALSALAAKALMNIRAAVRVTWTAGSGGRGLDRPSPVVPRLTVAANPAPPPVGPAALMVSSVRRNEGSPASRLKSLAYLDNVLARREATTAGADEALMLNGRGRIACAAAANLFWFEGDTLVTPALTLGALPGLMRHTMIDQARRLGIRVQEADSPLATLRRARGLCLTNSLIGARPVASLNGKPIAGHPALAELSAALA